MVTDVVVMREDSMEAEDDLHVIFGDGGLRSVELEVGMLGKSKEIAAKFL